MLLDKLKEKLSKDKHLSELIRGTSISFIYRIAGLILGYIFAIIIARAYGADAMGIYALSMVVISVATLIGKLGTDTALLKLVAESSSKNNAINIQTLYKKVLQLVVPFSIIIALCTYLLAPVIAHNIFHKDYLTKYFQIAAFAIVPFVLLSINREAIRGLKDIKIYSMLTNVAVVFIATILLSFFYTCSSDISMPLIAQVAAIFIVCLLSFFLWLIKKPKTETKQERPKSIKYKDIFTISIPMLITSSMLLIMGWTDIIILGIYTTDSEVGIYNIALKVSMITSIAIVAINTIAAPKFAEFWGDNDISGLSTIIQQSAKLIFWFSFPILLILVSSPSLILAIFGSEFSDGAPTLIVLAIGQFINSVSGSVGVIMNMTKHQKPLQYFTMTSAVLNILLNFILIPQYGILGAAISTTTSIIIWNVFCVYYIHKKLNISTWYIPLIKGIP